MYKKAKKSEYKKLRFELELRLPNTYHIYNQNRIFFKALFEVVLTITYFANEFCITTLFDGLKTEKKILKN